ncbi:MAG: PAS domain S-box protein [Proteobacteria bacterium]|nr:PAS domain S-box protein [Pseudomonadota bacterium]
MSSPFEPYSARIMVVENRGATGPNLADRLRGRGYTVSHQAASAEEAFRIARQDPPDLVVADVMIEGPADGIDAAVRIRDELELPVVLVTGDDDEALIERARLAQPSGCLLKPFRDHDLKITLEIALKAAEIDGLRREVEEALRNSEKTLYQFLENLPDMLYRFRLLRPDLTEEKKSRAMSLIREIRAASPETIDEVIERCLPILPPFLDGTVVYANRTASTLLGYPLDLVGRIRIDEILAPEHLEAAIRNTLKNLYYERLTDKEYDLIRHDGTRVPVSINSSVASHEFPIVFQGVVRDVSEIKRVETALKDSEERYRTILESIEEGYMESDLKGNFTLVSDWVIANSGYSPEEYRQTNFRNYVEPESAELLIRTFDGIYRTGRPAKDVDYVIITKDGRRRHHQLSASLNRDPRGRPTGYRAVIRDVTEKRRAELALQESEARYRHMVDHAPAGIYEVDLVNNRFVTLNDVICEMTGYTREELMAMPTSELLTDEGKAMFFDRLDKMSRGEPVPETMEYPLASRSGRIMWAALSIRFIYEGNRPVRAHVVAHDVTERKRTEEALTLSEAKYRQLVENAPVGIYEIDVRTNRFLSVNDVMSIYTGYSREELLAMSPWDLLTGESREKFTRRIEKTLQGEDIPPTVEYSLRTKAGREIWTMLNTRIEHEAGRPVRAHVIIHEITERKRAEEALALSEERYRLLVEHANEAIIVAQDGLIRFSNRRTQEITGLTYEQLSGRPFAELIHPDDRELVRERYEQRLRGDSVPTLYSFRVVDRSGQVKWVQINAILIEWEGRPATLNFFLEITEQKEAEERIRAALREKDVLLKEVHHRVKNNMQVISSLLSLQAYKESSEEALKALRESRDRVAAMAMVHEALHESDSLAEIDLGRYITKLTYPLIESYSVALQRPTLTLDLERDLTVSPDFAIPCGLALNELVTNSLKYAFSPEVEAEITISARSDPEGMIRLVISDNGRGLPEDLDWSRPGSLGLTLVRDLIERQLKGRIEMERKGGTTFILTARRK